MAINEEKLKEVLTGMAIDTRDLINWATEKGAPFKFIKTLREVDKAIDDIFREV